MNILLSGSHGLIGTALTKRLLKQGHKIFPLYRDSGKEKKHYWIPDSGIIHLDEGIQLDAVIHLAGENIADSRWSKKKKDKIFNSRVKGTKLLAEAISKLPTKPEVFLSGSAIGYYGDTGSNIVDEASNRGNNFLSDIAYHWEAATKEVEVSNIRTVHLRTGIVLSPDGGALKKMLLPFKLGLGGVIGDGNQYMSWVSINDMISAIEFLLKTRSTSGAYNIVAPEAVTNREFTKTLAGVLNRPAVLPMPAFIAKIVFGEMAQELLLEGTRVIPKKLIDAGYTFTDKNFEKTLKTLLEK